MPSCRRTPSYASVSSSSSRRSRRRWPARSATAVSASLAAETGTAVFKMAFARWVSQPGQPDLPGIFRELMDELRDVLANRASASQPGGW